MPGGGASPGGTPRVCINPRQHVSTPRSEYPRPQLVRSAWATLNGNWEFAYDDAGEGVRDGWYDGRPLPRQPGRIVVPFPYQARLSGIGDTAVHEVVWYARDFSVPAAWGSEGDLLLHFGAVDYAATVWVNGQEVGHNRGGHVPFSFDIAPYLCDGSNRLTVRVEDRQDPHQPRGKQSVSGTPFGIDYFCTTGIWQSVWLEPVPAVRIDHLVLETEVDARSGALGVTVHLHAPATGWCIEAEALESIDGGAVVARARLNEAGAVAQLRLTVPNGQLWSPQAPHLYGLRVRLFKGDTLLDEVRSYFGLRDVRVSDGHVVLNGEPTRLALALDQGYWSDGLLAAPSDAALRADIEVVKRLGFNGVRKHQKVEDPRWLYWCDRLGLLVWGEMANARAWSSEAEERLLAEWERAVRRDRNHPCIVTWVPLNESMGFPDLASGHHGQYAFVERLVRATRELDPTRPVIDNDGWDHTDVGDILAIHDYTPSGAQLRERYRETLAGGPLPPVLWNGKNPLFLPGAKYRGQPIVLSEVGGFLMVPPDVPREQLDWLYTLYGAYSNAQELEERYANVLDGLASLPFVAGFCYTQLTDVEHELNGLLTYDRRPKVEPERIAALNRRFIEGTAVARTGEDEDLEARRRL